MAGENILDPLSHRYPLFDEDRHSALCGELKELYVAITRPRERLWIFERTGSVEPLFAYWKKLGVVNQVEFDISIAGIMQSFCKHEEWNLRGQKFFNEGDYETASFCFKRSGDVYRWKWAKAASLQMEGQNKWHTDLGRARTCLSEAAEKYEEIGKLESAATCFMKLGNFAKASNIYLEKFDEPRFEEAGDCFKLARCWEDAAENYARGKCLSKCLSACTKGDLYELGWELMKKWPENVAKDSKVIFLKSWISRINKLSDIKSVLKIANAFPEDAYRILLEEENYVEASILQRARGNTLIEADLLERAAEYQKSTQRVVFHIMVQIFSTDGRDAMSLQFSQYIKKLVKKAEELAYKVSNSYGEEVRAELEFLCDQSCTLPNIVAHVKKAPKFRNVMVEIYGSRKMLEAYLKVDVGSYGHDEDEFFIRRGWHLDQVISEGFVSAQVLISALNMWKQRISRLYSFLQGCVTASQNKNYKAIYYKFFGVLK
ncbi:UvrD-like Helicase, ATP-binding domain, P-loop containing nucleoside triphosphate hydrolase, partial [Thalictrum thalictroides]